MNQSANRRARRMGLAVLAALLFGLWSSIAAAEVRRLGEWPSADETVSLSVTGVARAEAIRKLADEAGWSVVTQIDKGEPVDLHVKNQPAIKVLELLLSDGRYQAERTGTLIAISADTSPAAPAPSAEPAAEPEPSPSSEAAAPVDDETVAEETDEDDSPRERGEDRVVTGGSARVGKSEVVHDLAVFGGSADVLGTVTGDLAVLGGSATIREGARVHGDASTLGGSMTIEDNARVDGDVDVLGGKLTLSDSARIGGEVTNGGGGVAIGPGKHHGRRSGWSLSSLAQDAGSAMTRIALLFVFGAVLFGLATGRMERMQTEVAARPMRSFAYGVVGLLIAILTCVALCITLIGIPVAIVGILFAIFATYAGICAVLSAVGAGLVQHKSSNPYVHLGVGCLVYLVAGALPYIGGLITFALVLVGIGVLVTTRGAGFIKPRKGAEGSGPYRRAATTA